MFQFGGSLESCSGAKPTKAPRGDETGLNWWPFFKAPEMLFADILSHWNKAWAEEKVALNNV